jgi:hypothetical protein
MSELPIDDDAYDEADDALLAHRLLEDGVDLRKGGLELLPPIRIGKDVVGGLVRERLGGLRRRFLGRRAGMRRRRSERIHTGAGRNADHEGHPERGGLHHGGEDAAWRPQENTGTLRGGGR